MNRKPSFEEAVRQAKESHEWYLSRETDTTPEDVLAEYYYVFSDRVSELMEPSKDSTEWDALRSIAQRLLRDGKPLPEALAAWVVDVLEDVSRPKAEKRRARPVRQGAPVENWKRDQAIRSAVRDLVWQGFKATRSNDRVSTETGESLSDACAEGGSACDVVGVAFDITKFRTVAVVWERRNKSLDY